MKKLIAVCMLSLITCSVFGDSIRESGQHGYKYKPSVFDVVSINSPVKEIVAKFLLKTPKDFEINQVMFKVKNANELFIKDKDYSLTNLVSGPKGKELHIPISSLKNGFYRLFVRVRTVEKGKPNYKYHDYEFRTLHHDFVRFVIEKKSVVQMPDPVKNNATIAGVDSDNDGIRDDIQLWIESTYPVSSNVKKGLQQQARARQLNLVNASNKENSIISTRSYLNSSTCLAAILGGNEQMRLTNELNKRLINTKDRVYAELSASSHFSGQIYSLAATPEQEKALCDFEWQETSLVVPIPNPKINNSTLLGIDSDKDGIRDDIQLWILKSSKDKNVQSSLRQYARAFRVAFENKDDKAKSIQATIQNLRALDCVLDTMSDAGIPNVTIHQLTNELEALYTNTKERIVARLLISRNFHGQSFEGKSKEKSCDF